MQIEVNEQFRFASVWLTNDEKENLDVLNALQPLIEKYKAMKYRFVVFQSGTQNLLELTQGLLAHNKNLVRNSIGNTADEKTKRKFATEKKTSLRNKLAALKPQAENKPENPDVKKAKHTEEVL